VLWLLTEARARFFPVRFRFLTTLDVLFYQSLDTRRSLSRPIFHCTAALFPSSSGRSQSLFRWLYRWVDCALYAFRRRVLFFLPRLRALDLSHCSISRFRDLFLPDLDRSRLSICPLLSCHRKVPFLPGPYLRVRLSTVLSVPSLRSETADLFLLDQFCPSSLRFLSSSFCL